MEVIVDYITPPSFEVETDVVAAPAVTVESEVKLPAVGYDFEFLETIKEEMLEATEQTKEATNESKEATATIKETNEAIMQAEDSRVLAEEERQQGYAQMDGLIEAKADKAYVDQRDDYCLNYSSLYATTMSLYQIEPALSCVARLDKDHYIVAGSNKILLTDKYFNVIKWVYVRSLRMSHHGVRHTLYCANGIIYLLGDYHINSVYQAAYNVFDADLNFISSGVGIDNGGVLFSIPTWEFDYTIGHIHPDESVVYVGGRRSTDGVQFFAFFDPNDGYKLKMKERITLLNVEYDLSKMRAVHLIGGAISMAVDSIDTINGGLTLIEINPYINGRNGTYIDVTYQGYIAPLIVMGIKTNIRAGWSGMMLVCKGNTIYTFYNGLLAARNKYTLSTVNLLSDLTLAKSFNAASPVLVPNVSEQTLYSIQYTAGYSLSDKVSYESGYNWTNYTFDRIDRLFLVPQHFYPYPKNALLIKC